MATLTTVQAAEAANCSKGFISKLLRAGKIPGEQTHGPRGHWVVKMTRAEVKAYVATQNPRAGYKKNGHATKGTKATKGSSPLKELLEWAQLDPEVRMLLKAINDKFTTEELRLLLEL